MTEYPGFHSINSSEPSRSIPLGPGALLLQGYALPIVDALLHGIQQVVEAAPLRHLIMPNGSPMGVAMTNCGLVGWVSEHGRYRYSRVDPITSRSWPDMPMGFRQLAGSAAASAGYPGFEPAVCIVNRYAVGVGLQLHQDRDDTHDGQPVVSVSLGLPGVFQFGGQGRGAKMLAVPVVHGDVAVWGGPSRMHRHGVAPIAPGEHALTGPYRYNLTFRTARIPRR